MNVSYEYYRVFYYVAKYRNLTLAADALLSSQPNVTRTVKALEQALGCTLLVRSNRGVRLTPEGERLYQHVRIAVEQLQAGEEALSRENTLQSGVVSVGLTEVALHCCLLPVLSDFHRRYGNIRLRISNHSTPSALAALRSGAVDIAAVTLPLPPPAQKGLALRVIRRIREIAVAGADFSGLSGQPIRPELLAQYPTVSLGPQTQTYGVYQQWFLRHGLRFSPEIEAATADQIIPLVRQNLGIGFVPEDFMEQAQGLFPLTLTDPLPEFCICYARRIDHPLSPAAKELERMLLSHTDA